MNRWTPLHDYVRAHGVERSYSRGAVVHEGGEPVDHLWLVRSGWLARECRSPSIGRSITQVALQTDLIGHDAVMTGRLGDSVRALTDCTLAAAPVAMLRRAVEEDPALAAALAEMLAIETVFLREGLCAVGQQLGSARLCAFLLQTHGRLVAAGLIEPGATMFPLPMTQDDVGAAIGLTPIHTNRVLKEHREAGVLALRAGRATIMDMPLVRKLAAIDRLAEPVAAEPMTTKPFEPAIAPRLVARAAIAG